MQSHEEIEGGERTLDILSVADACAQGKRLNWFQFFMNEFVEGIIEAYSSDRFFYYVYKTNRNTPPLTHSLAMALSKKW